MLTRYMPWESATICNGQYNFIVHKAYLDALHDITRARKFHERVTRIDQVWWMRN